MKAGQVSTPTLKDRKAASAARPALADRKAASAAQPALADRKATSAAQPALADRKAASAARPALAVRKAVSADTPALVEMLARAFDKDPLCDWFVRKDARRSEGMARLFRSSIEALTLPFGEVYATEDLSGAALWTPPGKWNAGLWTLLKSMPDFLGATGWKRAWGVKSGVDAMQAHHPRRPSYYLYTLGVEPSRQGRGVGSALMRPVLGKCDAEGVPAYVETSNEKNLPLYQRHGFELTGQLVLPYSGPKLWLLWREPRSR